MGRLIGRVGPGEDIGVVDRREPLAVRRDIHETTGADPAGLHREVFRYRKVSIDFHARLHAAGTRLGHCRKTPDRHPPPSGLGGGKEIPIAHRFAKRGIGDIIGRQGERIDAQARLALAERGLFSLLPAGFAERVAFHQKIGHLLSLLKPSQQSRVQLARSTMSDEMAWTKLFGASVCSPVQRTFGKRAKIWR